MTLVSVMPVEKILIAALVMLCFSGCATQNRQSNLNLAHSQKAATSSTHLSINELLIVDCAVPDIANNTYKPIKTNAKHCRRQNGNYKLNESRDNRIRIWMQNAKLGDPVAQNHIGELFEKGIDQAPDYFQARKWYRMAAEQGLQRAQTNLAVLYQNGLGVEKTRGKALYWYGRAARDSRSKTPISQEYGEITLLRQRLTIETRRLRQMRQNLQTTLEKLQIATHALKSLHGIPHQRMALNDTDSRKPN